MVSSASTVHGFESQAHHNKQKEGVIGPFKKRNNIKGMVKRLGVVVAQLAAESLPIPEDPDSKPVTANFFNVNFCRKDENKDKKRPGCTPQIKLKRKTEKMKVNRMSKMQKEKLAFQ